jgi:hypothetical protein
MLSVTGGKKPKGKGRGKNSLNYPYPQQRPGQQRLRDYIQRAEEPIAGPSNQRSTRSIASNFTEDLSSTNSVRGIITPTPVTSPRNSNVRQEKKKVYLQKIDCFLNSICIDAIEDRQSQDECIQAFWRLFNANGQLNALNSCGISYAEFR